MFRVEWTQSALNEVTAGWIQADSTLRAAITAASHAADQRLAADPLNEGESRPGNRRITFIAPLSLRFHVDQAHKVVTVLHVRIFRRR